MNLVLTEAEAGRAAGASDPAAWSAAIELWEGRGRRFEPAYARYRRAEALLAAGGRTGGGGRRSPARRAHGGVARRRPAAAHGRGSSPRGRGSQLDEAAASEAAGDDGEAGLRLPSPLTRREREVLVLLARGPIQPPDREPRCSSARAPPASTSRTSWASSA